MGAKFRHGPVEHPGAEGEQGRILCMRHLVESESGQYPLQLETEQVEGMGTFGGIESAEPAPAVAVDLNETRFELGQSFGVGLAPGKKVPRPSQPLLSDGQHLLIRHPRQLLSLARCGGVPEEIVEFDYMAVHVDDASGSCVGHGGAPFAGFGGSENLARLGRTGIRLRPCLEFSRGFARLGTNPSRAALSIAGPKGYPPGP